MPAQDLYNVTPGFHIKEAFETAKAFRDGFELEHATDTAGLLTCGLAALDGRADGFGSSGDELPSETPEGVAIRSLSADECEAILQEHVGGEGYAAPAALPPWLAAIAIQFIAKTIEEHLPKILDRLFNRK